MDSLDPHHWTLVLTVKSMFLNLDTHVPRNQPPYTEAPGGRLTIIDHRGKTLCQIAGGDATAEAGDFYAPHNVRVDANGDLYLTEVVWAAGGGRGLAPEGCPALQKLTRN